VGKINKCLTKILQGNLLGEGEQICSQFLAAGVVYYIFSEVLLWYVY
jgi:hypothetical protein